MREMTHRDSYSEHDELPRSKSLAARAVNVTLPLD
jgi:hypothetical protein